MYQISLFAAFIAGMVALFAPCCITYLLPAYFGNIFKEKKRVFTMTVIYSLGIMTVMLPVVLGIQAISQTFFKLHDATYLVGSGFMFVVGLLALFNIKLPMPKIKKQTQAIDIPSTYMLGIVSGITSSCCAPVLIGVLALSAFSPTIFMALGVGVAYVFGMVAPLYIASLFIHKRNILERPIFRKKIGTIYMGSKSVPVTVNNLVAFLIFTLTGLLMGVLTITGNLTMDADHMQITKTIQNTAMFITEKTKNISAVNIIFVIISILILKKLKDIMDEEQDED